MFYRSWKRSREAPIWKRLKPEQAQTAVLASYGRDAKAEVLLRAFLSERDQDDAAVGFWLKVHEALAVGERAIP